MPGWSTCACSYGKILSSLGGISAKSSEISPRRAGSLLLLTHYIFIRVSLRKVRSHLGELARLSEPAHLHLNSPLMLCLRNKAVWLYSGIIQRTPYKAGISLTRTVAFYNTVKNFSYTFFVQLSAPHGLKTYAGPWVLVCIQFLNLYMLSNDFPLDDTVKMSKKELENVTRVFRDMPTSCPTIITARAYFFCIFP